VITPSCRFKLPILARQFVEKPFSQLSNGSAGPSSHGGYKIICFGRDREIRPEWLDQSARLQLAFKLHGFGQNDAEPLDSGLDGQISALEQKRPLGRQSLQPKALVPQCPIFRSVLRFEQTKAKDVIWSNGGELRSREKDRLQATLSRSLKRSSPSRPGSSRSPR
jgi:hypothetical protein